jgi:YebC/PmpR family DNA-binding regulatory protein
MSGHNKWSKIKHKKAASDAQKSKLFSKHASMIAVESRNAKGDLAAPGLIAAIERAKKDSMPKDNIDRAVQKGKSADSASLIAVTYETYGPGGSAIIITAVTDSTNRTTQEVRHILTKNGYALGTAGSASWAFIKTQDAYLPTNPLELSPEDGEKLAALIEALTDHDDVQDVFTSADTPDTV